MKLTVVILAMTTTEGFFNMTSECISSLCESEENLEKEIIIVESNKNYSTSGFVYPDFVKIIIPSFTFNFHKFLNVGIKAATGDYIALCNNDLIFQDSWFSEILLVGQAHNEIMSFSPVGKIEVDNSLDASFEIGYKVMTHVKGWCIVVKKELFHKINLLDETFDFYFADNDYAMTLKSRNIKHALVYKSHVVHLEKQSTDKIKNNESINPDILSKYKIPKYLNEKKYEWVFNNEKNLSGFLKFHNKWGSPNFLYKKNKLADILIKNKLGYLVRFFLKLN
ncbi:hypothetical protein ADIWIN_0286 [Winogradskyella psychrotolerans RS-3]|uniref:Glycosyltransferase 2-like domain-containing protein n=1 Tax=Winogradskyella psychrotolerans RS-3 TaxID=641526 RepID=S7VX72_9FLAO|nr:glycosyltransferase [Winogradskyella psychrotolerans]EPR74696.1 hypothetical protein ADIWIN_0286 [Winogradskyella psychrotolerans RS-3]